MKIQVDFVSDECSTHHSENVETQFTEPGHYFYRHHWETDSRQFTSAGSHQMKQQKYLGKHCECCDKVAREKEDDEIKIVGPVKPSSRGRNKCRSIRCRSIDYRLLDFVYIFLDSEGNEPYGIGQIVKIQVPRPRPGSKLALEEDKIFIKVALFEKIDHMLPSLQEEYASTGEFRVRDSRRVFSTGMTITINATLLDGKCVIRHRDHIDDIDEFKDQHDTFWVAEKLKDHVDPKSVVGLNDLCPLPVEDLRYSTASQLEYSSRTAAVNKFLNEGTKPNVLVGRFESISSCTESLTNFAGTFQRHRRFDPRFSRSFGTYTCSRDR